MFALPRPHGLGYEILAFQAIAKWLLMLKRLVILRSQLYFVLVFSFTLYAKRRWILNSNRVISSAGMNGLIDPKNEVKKDRKSGELSRRNFEKVA